MAAIGVYSFICYKAFYMMKDMHGYQGREKKTIEEK
jgi:hypothetical protein